MRNRGENERDGLTSQRASQTGLLLAGGILAVTLLAYGPAMQAGYIWDDSVFLTGNPLIQAPDGLYRFWFTTQAIDYFPLTSSMLWLEWRLWGNDPAGYHVVNILLHGLAAVLLWRVLKALDVPGAYLAALVFAVHPVAVASVAWITERKNTLPMVLYLASLLAYLRFERTRRLGWYAAALLAFLAGLLAKPSGVMLPAVLLLLTWYRGRITQRDVYRTIPFFVLSFMLGLVTVWFQRTHAIGGGPVHPEGLASRIAATGWIIWFYLYKIVLPINLSMIYPRWHVDGSSIVSYIPLLALLGGLALFWVYRKSWSRGPLAALGYFILMLLPVLGFVDMSFAQYSLVADHLQYIAMPAILALLCGCLAVLAHRAGWRPWIQFAAAGAIVAVLGTLTFQQAGLYEDPETFWQATLKANPRASAARAALGEIRLKQGRLDDAVAQLRSALELNPDSPAAQTNMGNALVQLGKLDEAIQQLRTAIQLDPDNYAAHGNLGAALVANGQFAPAVAELHLALRLNPGYLDAHTNLGIALLETGRADEAADEFRKVLAAAPNSADAHNNLGWALAKGGHRDEALRQYQEALRLRPDHADARKGLDELLAGQTQPASKPK